MLRRLRLRMAARTTHELTGNKVHRVRAAAHISRLATNALVLAPERRVGKMRARAVAVCTAVHACPDHRSQDATDE